MGMHASPLLMQKGEASAVPARFYHSSGEGVQCQKSSHIRSAGRPVNRAETEEAYRGHIPQVKEYGPNIKTFGAHQKNGQMKQLKVRKAALSRLSDAESHTRFLAAKESDTS